MKILIAGGTGFIGQHLIPILLKNQHEITVISRSINKIKKTFNEEIVKAVSWEQLSVDYLTIFDVIINLAGYGIGEKPWSKSIKQLIKTSRTESTQKLAQFCAKAGSAAPRLINASAVGIYGLQEPNSVQPNFIDESYTIPFGKPTDFLSEIGQAWESALIPAIEAGCPVTIMRFGVVINKGGGIVKKLLPAVKLSLASVLGTGQQGFSWVDMRDLIAAIEFLLAQYKLQGPFNITSPYPISQRDFIYALAKAYHRRCFLKTPAIALKLILGQMADELLLKGQWIYPQRLLAAGFNFKYAEIAEALTP